jgi:dolichyl-phosphate beta-glucosyltransferase
VTAGAGNGETPHVSIVIPAYNEESRLPASLNQLLSFLSAQPFRSEVVISDDGSTDGTAEVVHTREAAGVDENVALRLLRNPHGGKGAAIRAGMLDAKGDYIFFADADLATPCDEALKLLEVLTGGAHVAIGSRIQPDGSDMRASQPATRRVAGRAFTLMRKAMLVLRDIGDTQCPMKGFRRDAARAIFARQRLSGWIFDAEVLYIARRLGLRIIEVPVRWQHMEGSRVNVRPRQAFEVLRDLARLRLLHRSLRST